MKRPKIKANITIKSDMPNTKNRATHQNNKVYRLEYPDKQSKNNACASYSQNLGEVCGDYTCSLYRLQP